MSWRNLTEVEVPAAQEKLEYPQILSAKCLVPNMLLSTCHSFYEKVVKTPPLVLEKCLDDLTKLTCYGKTFGNTTMVVIYKMMVDFSTNSLIYEERFRYPDSPMCGHLINCGLAYVLDKVGFWNEDDS